jgi:hypothetical protein
MIGLRRVLWGIFPEDLSAVWEHYWTTTSMCALAGLLASEILYWRWGIHTYIHTYKWYDTEFVSESTSLLLLDSVLCMNHVLVLMCVYEKAYLVMRWLQCWRFATDQDQ